MSWRNVPGFVLLIAVMSLMAGCGDTPQPLDLAEPQMAKGGKGGKGGDGGTFALLEYFVFPDGDGGSLVHVVGEGNVPEVNLNVVHDNPFNGIRDNATHYEYTTFAPLPVSVLETSSDGTFHMDIPWDGLRNDPSEAQLAWGEVQEWFTDFLTTDVDNNGADPFTFDVRFWTGETSLMYVRPQGIVMGGVETGTAEADVVGRTHPSMSVRSYATFKGAPAPESVYLTEVSFTNVQCRVVKIREGRGKNAISRQVARITGDIGISTASTAGIQPSTWVELHVLDVTDPGNPVFSEGRSQDDGNPADGVYGSLTEDLGAVPEGPMTIVLAVDYVFPTRDEWSWAYNPALNTNVGFTTDSTTVHAIGDPAPLASSMPTTVNCN